MENSSQSCTLKMLKSQQVFVLLTGESPLSYVTCSKISLTKVGSYTICWYCKNHHRTQLKIVQHAIKFIHIISRSNFDKIDLITTLTMSPGPKWIWCTFPLKRLVISIVALSLCTSQSGWNSSTWSPCKNGQLSKFNCSYIEIDASQEL